MSVDWAEAAFNLMGSATVAGVVVVVAQGWLNRKKTGAETARTSAEAEKTEADAADVLTARALTMVTKLEEQVGRTEDRLRQVDTETTQLRTDLRAATAQVDELGRKLGHLIAEIWSPTATIERLREMVGPPGINGRH